MVRPIYVISAVDEQYIRDVAQLLCVYAPHLYHWFSAFADVQLEDEEEFRRLAGAGAAAKAEVRRILREGIARYEQRNKKGKK